MLSYIKEGTDDRLYAIAELIRRGVELALIYNSTKIDMFFLEKFKNIVEFEKGRSGQSPRHRNVARRQTHGF